MQHWSRVFGEKGGEGLVVLNHHMCNGLEHHVLLKWHNLSHIASFEEKPIQIRILYIYIIINYYYYYYTYIYIYIIIIVIIIIMIIIIIVIIVIHIYEYKL